MIHEDINLRWYNFDDSEEIILDDRLDDLSVNTQGIVYTEEYTILTSNSSLDAWIGKKIRYGPLYDILNW